MKKEFVINYRKRFDKTGCVYNQTINITKNTLSKLKDILQCETVLPRYKKDDMVARRNLTTSFGAIENGYVYMNLTQREYFNQYLKLNLKNRNTTFCIID